MSLKNPKTLRKCSENLQPQMPVLKNADNSLALFKSYQIE